MQKAFGSRARRGADEVDDNGAVVVPVVDEAAAGKTVLEAVLAADCDGCVELDDA